VDSDGTPVASSGFLDGATFVVYRQPISLDRFTAHDVTAAEPLGSYTVVFRDGISWLIGV